MKLKIMICATVILLMIIPYHAQAEYYFVCEGQPVTWIYKSPRHKVSHHKRHHKVSYHKHRHKISHYKKRSGYKISVHYVWYAVPCGTCAPAWIYTDCGNCRTWYPNDCQTCGTWIPDRWDRDFYEVSYVPSKTHKHHHRYEIEEFSYNPDMSTGDDDADLHPDMQINY